MPPTLPSRSERPPVAAELWAAAWLIAGSPFFWAPPLWVLALMATPGGRTDRHQTVSRFTGPPGRE